MILFQTACLQHFNCNSKRLFSDYRRINAFYLVVVFYNYLECLNLKGLGSHPAYPLSLFSYLHSLLLICEINLSFMKVTPSSFFSFQPLINSFFLNVLADSIHFPGLIAFTSVSLLKSSFISTQLPISKHRQPIAFSIFLVPFAFLPLIFSLQHLSSVTLCLHASHIEPSFSSRPGCATLFQAFAYCNKHFKNDLR